MPVILSIIVDMSVAGLGDMPPINVEQDDDLHYRFEITGGTIGSSAMELRYAFDGHNTPASDSTTLILDGSLNTLDIRSKPWVVPAVTTTASGVTGILHVYTRRSSYLDGGGA